MLSKRINGICFLLVSFLFISSASTRAQSLASAKILSSEGPVEIQRRAQGQAQFVKVDYRVRDELLAGDVIKTAKGGRLVLGLTDGSQAVIGEQTVVEIADLSRSPRTIFNVLRGKTRIKIEKVGGRPNPYRVNTPTAVIAVRGTLFDVLVSSKETQVFVYEGEVGVSNLLSPDVFIILSPGQKTRVQQTGQPEPASRFDASRTNNNFSPPDRNRNGGGGPQGERDSNGPEQRPRRSAPTRDNPPSDGPEHGRRDDDDGRPDDDRRKP